MQGNLLTEWATLLLGSFADAGVTDVVISPGSRSTPFVLAAAQNSRLRSHDSMDERSAAFFALGQGRVTGRPSLLICTSGTAGAHYLPAAIEACLSRTPLLMLTSDRPFELMHAGASQAIDQTKMFGDHVRAFFELGTPDAFSGALRAVRRIAAQAVATSIWPMPGAVHVNARARKPLEPAEASSAEEVSLHREVEALLKEPISTATRPIVSLDPQAVEAAVRAIRRAKRGVIAAGAAPIRQSAAREAIFRLAAATGFPVLAESASQLRFGEVRDGCALIDPFDPLLRSAHFRREARPDLMLQIGRSPISTGFERYSAEHVDVPNLVLGEEGWHDPFSRSTTHLVADVAVGAAQLAGALGREPSQPPSGWTELFRRGAREAKIAAARIADPVSLDEGSVARALVEAAPPSSALLFGNSLAIRLVDTFAEARALELLILSQRGAAGIDGLISGAAGSSRSLDRPLGVLIGDVSFLHDSTGLALAGQIDHRPLVIAVVQNRGGRIFEQLPITKAGIDPDTLAHLTTPHDVDLEPICRGFGLRFARADTRTGLDAALLHAYGRNGCTVIEAMVPASEAASLFERVWAETDHAIRAPIDAWRAAEFAGC